MIDYMTIIFFIIFLAGLVKFSQIALVKAIKISDYLGTSHFTIGFILVALCTSLPELFVSVESALAGKGAIAVGNVIGSNIADIGLVLGACTLALASGIKLQRREMIENAEILMIITFIPLYFLIAKTMGAAIGLVLLIIFVGYVIFLKKREGATAIHSTFNPETHKFEEVKMKVPRKNLTTPLIIFIVSIVGLIVCAHFLIETTIEMINILFIPPAFIGATILALGTSLPELSVDIRAVRKGYVSLAFGDIIGSSVINLTLVLGTASIIAPLTITLEVLAPAIGFLMALNILLWYMLFKFNGIPRKFGALFIALYVLFIATEIGILIS